MLGEVRGRFPLLDSLMVLGETGLKEKFWEKQWHCDCGG